MLEIMLDKHIMYVLMGIFATVGIVSKCISNIALKRLVHAAGNMNKSTHPLMRLVRAKFEHACMISERVENVRVFVDKYLYEYKVAGMKLYSWRRMETGSAGLCLLTGLLGALMEFSVHGMQDAVLRTGVAGAGVGVLVYLFHLTTDENYRMEAARNYMVDYLENVCLRRYEKAYQKEIKVMTPEMPAAEFGIVDDGAIAEFENGAEDDSEGAQPESQKEAAVMRSQSHGKEKNEAAEPLRPHPGKEVPSPRTSPEVTPPVMPEPYEAPDVTSPIKASVANGRQESVQGGRKNSKQDNRHEEKKEKIDKDILIRQILEEFMA